jgi:hypothetical protein
VGNNLLLAVDRIEVVRTVEVVRTAVDHIAVGHIVVDRIAAVVGGIHLLLLPYLSILSCPRFCSIPIQGSDLQIRGYLLIIVKLPRQ